MTTSDIKFNVGLLPRHSWAPFVDGEGRLWGTTF
jgi:hypothetical protein